MADYDFQNDWFMLRAKGAIPPEIVSFMVATFQIMEIRERVAKIKGIKFEVRTREQNHPVPHVHAEYDGYNISIAIETGEVLAGNLPKSQQRIAVDWVKANESFLTSKWNEIAISATSILTMSRMG